MGSCFDLPIKYETQIITNIIQNSRINVFQNTASLKQIKVSNLHLKQMIFINGMLYLANRPHVVSDIGYKRADVADLSQSLFYLMVSLPDRQYK